jgi:hypothetical protein
MYTIKINVFEFQKCEGKEEEEKVLTETYYTEGEKLKMKSYRGPGAENGGQLIQKLCSDFPGVDTWVVNPKDAPIRLFIIGYFDPKGEYKHIALFEYAEVYILQNGKTIDKIIV